MAGKRRVLRVGWDAAAVDPSVRHERFEIHTGADDKSTVLFISMSSVPGWCCFLPRGMAVARRSLKKLHVALQSYLSD